MEIRHWVFLAIVLVIGVFIGRKFPKFIPFVDGTTTGAPPSA